MTIDLFRKALKAPLPGWKAQSKMINYDRPGPEKAAKIDPGARKSAVLALLYPKNDELHTVLILRNVYEGTHSGQISFPGGKIEEEDHSSWQAALREANEEVGIEKSDIEKIGELTDVYIPPSRFLVTPFLGYIDYYPDFKPDRIEVAQIIETPFETFLNPRLLREKEIFIKSYNKNLPVKYFDVDSHTVWGATAMILSEISEIARQYTVGRD